MCGETSVELYVIVCGERCEFVGYCVWERGVDLLCIVCVCRQVWS